MTFTNSSLTCGSAPATYCFCEGFTLWLSFAFHCLCLHSLEFLELAFPKCRFLHPFLTWSDPVISEGTYGSLSSRPGSPSCSSRRAWSYEWTSKSLGMIVPHVPRTSRTFSGAPLCQTRSATHSSKGFLSQFGVVSGPYQCPTFLDSTWIQSSFYPCPKNYPA